MEQNTGIRAVLKREVGRILSRRRYICLMLVFPLLTFALFVSIFGEEGLPKSLPIAVIDHDNSSVSRTMIRNIDATEQTKIVAHLTNETEAMHMMQSGKIYAYVSFPENFMADVLANRQPTVAYYYQNSVLIAGSLIYKDLTQVLKTLSAGVALQGRVARGQSADEAMAQLQPITVDAYMLSNPWANYSVYLSTTLLPNMLQVFILLLTVYCICIELKQKTSQEWMATAGGSITKALIGKLLPYTITFSLLGIMGNIILFGWLDFPIQTNIFSMLTASVLYVLAYQGWGVLIAGLIQRMSSCITVASLLGALALTLSGLTFPIMAMPSFATGWSHLLPIRHYLVIYTNQALNGFGFANCWTSYLALIFFALLPLTVGKRLKKELLNPTVEQ